MSSLSSLMHHCEQMPRAGISICWGAACFDAEELGWYLFVERLTTESDLQENQYLEEVGETLWATAVEIKCCPYCGVELAGARSILNADDFGCSIHIDYSGWYGQRC